MGTSMGTTMSPSKNTNLRRTRDLLLPKLISGELDVEEKDLTNTQDIE